jgi:hypothetical protein
MWYIHTIAYFIAMRMDGKEQVMGFFCRQNSNMALQDSMMLVYKYLLPDVQLKTNLGTAVKECVRCN